MYPKNRTSQQIKPGHFPKKCEIIVSTATSPSLSLLFLYRIHTRVILGSILMIPAQPFTCASCEEEEGHEGGRGREGLQRVEETVRFTSRM